MKDKLEEIRKRAKDRIEEVKDLQGLNELRVKVLGKKGELTEILRGMKDLSAEERPVIGNLVNKLKDDIETSIEKIKSI